MNVDIVTERGDALIATAARASFNRRADQYTDEQNERLTKFLVGANPQHWAPLAHVRLTLRLEHWMIIHKKLDAYNKTGMIDIRRGDGVVDVSHSLWGWYLLLRDKKVHFYIVNSVIDHLKTIAPVACKILELDKYREKSGNESKYVHRAPVSYETDFVTLRIDLPIAIARQMQKHQVGFVFSEASGRYICYSKVHKPVGLHRAPDNKKQGAGAPLGALKGFVASRIISASHALSMAAYSFLHRVVGLAPEEARAVCPLYTSTTFVVTASRADWDRFLMQRLDAAAQTDIRILAQLVDTELKK